MGKHFFRVRLVEGETDHVLLECDYCDAQVRIERWLMVEILTRGNTTLTENVKPSFSICWSVNQRTDREFERYRRAARNIFA